MKEHQKTRNLLPLAASGDLAPEELRRVRRHLAQCESCRRDQAELDALADGLRRVPTPQPRPEIVAEAFRLAVAKLPAAGAARERPILLAPLVALSWILAALSWPFVANLALSAATLELPAWPFGDLLTVYSAVGFLVAAAAAVAVSHCAGSPRRIQ